MVCLVRKQKDGEFGVEKTYVSMMPEEAATRCLWKARAGAPSSIGNCDLDAGSSPSGLHEAVSMRLIPPRQCRV